MRDHTAITLIIEQEAVIVQEQSKLEYNEKVLFFRIENQQTTFHKEYLIPFQEVPIVQVHDFHSCFDYLDNGAAPKGSARVFIGLRKL